MLSILDSYEPKPTEDNPRHLLPMNVNYEMFECKPKTIEDNYQTIRSPFKLKATFTVEPK